MVSPHVLPPELVTSFEAVHTVLPEASRRARIALEWIFDRAAPTRGRLNQLTGDGFPVELAFSSLDSAIRYTCELSGCTLSTRERLRFACELLDGLGQSVRFPLVRLQERCASLTWGAWLGGYHTTQSDQYKVYVEAPEALGLAARDALSNALGKYRTLLESHAYTLRIAGFVPVSGKLELYFRGRGLEPRELCGLLRFSGLEDQEGSLLAMIEAASRQPSRQRLPGNQHGFSISFDRRGDVETFTFFVFARSLFGTDHATRAALLALAETLGWDLKHYFAATAMLARDDTDGGPHHGIVSFIVTKGHRLGVSIGLRPWIAK
jgi:hypothetical protein